MSVKRFWKPAEVARYYRLNPATVYRRIQSGDIPAVKIGGQYRVPEQDALTAGRRVAIGAQTVQSCLKSASVDSSR